MRWATARGLFRSADVLEEDRELVAPHPEQHVAVADATLDARGGNPQQLVTRVMAQAVIHNLEAIEVQEHHGESPSGAARATRHRIQLLGEAGAVREAGQVVMVGLVAYALFLGEALRFLLAQQPAIAQQDPEYQRIDGRQAAQHAGEDLPLAALHVVDKRGDVAVDLHHGLHGHCIVNAYWHVGRDDVAVRDHAFPGIEAIAECDIARRRTVARQAEAGIARLVLADLARIGGEHGEAVGVVDLHLDHAQPLHQEPKVALKRPDLLPRGKLSRRDRRSALDESGMARPDRIRERLGQRDVGARFFLYQRVKHELAVEQ